MCGTQAFLLLVNKRILTSFVGMTCVVKDSPNKLSIVNIPTYIEEEQIRELVETQQADLSSLFSFLDLETGSKVHEFADQSSS